MPRKGNEAQRSFWDDAARKNALYYVDTTMDFDSPDREKFFETGRVVVAEALDGAAAAPPGRGLAVEVGCGVGRICLALSERFDRVVGIDISAEMLTRARELVRSDKITFQLGDGASLRPLADAEADLILSFTVFQHIPDPEVIDAYIVEAGRVLRPGGLLVFQWNNTPGALWWKARRAALALAQRRGVGDERGRNAREFLGSRVPLKRMESSLRRGGMTLAGTKGLGSLFAWAWAVKRSA